MLEQIDIPILINLWKTGFIILVKNSEKDFVSIVILKDIFFFLKKKEHRIHQFCD